jgi:DNA-binding response OmpR family regulator
MTTHKALLLGGSQERRYAKLLTAQKFEVEQPAKSTWTAKLKAAARANVDLVVVDLNMPKASGAEIVQQLSESEQVPSVVIVGDSEDLLEHEESLVPLLSRPGFDWVRAPVDVAEFRLRINRVTARAAPSAEAWNMPELRSDASGRLDATRIARHFGWTLSALSRALRASVQAVHKTPDAPALQKRLEKLERAALLARRSVSSKASTFRKWLNTPMPDLDGEKPGDLLLKKPDIVVQWLEDAAVGQPG